MAQEPVDLKLYFEVLGILSKPSKGGAPKGIVSKYGGQFIPQVPEYPDNDFDEVYPKLYLGSRVVVEDRKKLKSLGITHMVNASMGPKFNQTNTSQEFYKESNISFFGISAMDVVSFKIFPYFRDAANFIEQALESNGKVYVHCQQGVSRSATIILAFLMLKRDTDLLSAVKIVRAKRAIHPNDGFVKQLCQLEEEIKSAKL